MSLRRALDADPKLAISLKPGLLRSGTTSIRFIEELPQQLARLCLIEAGIRIPALYSQLIVKRPADDIENRLLGRPDCALRISKNVPSQFFGLAQKMLVGNDFRYHIALQCLLSVYWLSRENHLHRHPDAAGVDDPDQAAIAVMEASAGFE